MQHFKRKPQAGFTLVEIAIVLVIIGVLLGGVLKGTEMIDNSKVKRAVSDINGISAAYYAYVDRYQRLPGDDGPALANLTARGGNWNNITAFGNANGVIVSNRNQSWNAAAGTEHGAFWQHLRAAGLLTGDVAAVGPAAQPRNAFGGLIGVVTQPVNGNLQGTKICMSQIPGKAALALDTQSDDGNGATGRMRATLGGNRGNTNPNNTALTGGGIYNEDNNYTLCTQV
ncbi:MAG: prepilin-type N-terminal cleavage/methylation domain-containing protein [Cellvibrionaceae bacterium]|nr:prepilin-type N-terminal cleavage/methylation domain-containing protein [Cellvibrionaceae bacterium]